MCEFISSLVDDITSVCYQIWAIDTTGCVHSWEKSMNILSTFELSLTHLTFLPSPISPGSYVLKFQIFFSFLFFFLFVCPRHSYCVDCLLFSSYSLFSHIFIYTYVYLLILSVMILSLFWFCYSEVFFLLHLSHMSVCRLKRKKKPLEQITMNRSSSSSWFSIDNTRQFIHIEDASNSIVGVLPLWRACMHACLSSVMMGMDMFTLILSITEHFMVGIFVYTCIYIYIVVMRNRLVYSTSSTMRLIRQKGEGNKWLHLSSTGIEMKPLIILVNCAQEPFED